MNPVNRSEDSKFSVKFMNLEYDSKKIKYEITLG